MENDIGAYYLLILGPADGFGSEAAIRYDNAEAARKAAHLDEKLNTSRTRQLFKILPHRDPVEVMI